MANSYLNRTMSTGTSRRILTLSYWIKRSKLSSGYPRICSYDQDDNNRFENYIHQSDHMYVEHLIGGIQNINLVTNRVFRDTSAWYHVVVAIDTNQGTAADRVKLYINGVQETSFSTATYPSQYADLIFGTANVFRIGETGYQSGGQYFDGYISHAAHVDGQALAPTVFGETDSTSGIWKFKSPSGVTWGTNGFHLKFENSGAMGTDSSGNSNTFTVNGNLTQAVDTPSNVYATWNPLARSTAYSGQNAPTNGNTTFVSGETGTNYPTYTSTLGVSSGKYYFECKMGSSGGPGAMIGISDQKQLSSFFGSGTYDYGYWGFNGNTYNNNSSSSYGNTFGNNDIIGCAVDLDNNKLYFHKNGTYQNSGVPTSGSTGTGAISISAASATTTGFYFFTAGDAGDGDAPTVNANFGNGFFGTTAITSAGSNGNGSLFEYDVPSGYYALNTKNINSYG